jgi:hypothetical protein
MLFMYSLSFIAHQKCQLAFPLIVFQMYGLRMNFDPHKSDGLFVQMIHQVLPLGKSKDGKVVLGDSNSFFLELPWKIGSFKIKLALTHDQDGLAIKGRRSE